MFNNGGKPTFLVLLYQPFSFITILHETLLTHLAADVGATGIAISWF